MVGCNDPGDAPDHESEAQGAIDITPEPISKLPIIDATANQRILGELLARPTDGGETTAVYVKLADTDRSQLKGSLLRIVGPTDSPQLLFRADALAQLGVIGKSPGPDFFVTFATLSPEQLTAIQRNEDQIAKGVFGKPTRESIVFNNRTAVGRVNNPTIDPGIFRPGGGGVPINACAIRPTSTQKEWDQALFIRDPAVVQDPARTWDPCTGAGTPGGVWTFGHLMTEMSIGSGKTPSDFVRDWLSLWLNNYTVNGDVVAARTQMFNQVIQPWEAASGGVATLVNVGGVNTLSLTAPLDLDRAPFLLEAIVNRIDLGDTASGPAGYSGSTTSLPVTAGELRFIFDVVQPQGGSCGKKLFTTIFEYGVPGAGCGAVVNWARQWTGLAAMAGFTAAYGAQLQSMTESVVVHGAAPSKGNQNAINQVRTNEIAIGAGAPWELREFTLSDENPAAGTDTPSSGGLRPHTTALTINDGAFNALSPGDPTVTSFMSSLTVTPPLSLPNQCNVANLQVPFLFAGQSFRAGNALIGPGHWNMLGLTAGSSAADLCRRHTVSLNTCHGCHHDDTATFAFTQISPTAPIPVPMSSFLTGGGVGSTFPVPDPQVPSAVTWRYADLERRWQRLFDIASCTSCLTIRPIRPEIVQQIARLGPVPIDPGPDFKPDFQVGPFTSLDAVKQVLDLRVKMLGDALVSQPADFVRTTQVFSH
ncbi:MAG TPA: hypothetical protein VFP84_17230 [Kofleriaceae bacterium]|nr:hypothetical protein [Kofleriaceae bacterium]